MPLFSLSSKLQTIFNCFICARLAHLFYNLCCIFCVASEVASREGKALRFSVIVNVFKMVFKGGREREQLFGTGLLVSELQKVANDS